jgi:ABC-type antimicrobial peptide transport system permease subunit
LGIGHWGLGICLGIGYFSRGNTQYPFNAAQRTKEIGIRKTLGANRTNIAVLLRKDLVIVMLIASIVSIPLSYFAVREWMSHFRYQVDVDFLAIAIIIASALSAVLMVVIVQSLKSMATNPADVLRNN